MGFKAIKRSLPVFSIGIVMKLTELSARQIRYYETHGLVIPQRTEGQTRLFSMNDIDKLLEIKEHLQQGLNLRMIKKMTKDKEMHHLSDHALREKIRHDLVNVNERQHRKEDILSRGDLARFYKNK